MFFIFIIPQCSSCPSCFPCSLYFYVLHVFHVLHVLHVLNANSLSCALVTWISFLYQISTHKRQRSFHLVHTTYSYRKRKSTCESGRNILEMFVLVIKIITTAVLNLRCSQTWFLGLVVINSSCWELNWIAGRWLQKPACVTTRTGLKIRFPLNDLCARASVSVPRLTPVPCLARFLWILKLFLSLFLL